jgi:hypothetical protein
MNSLQNLTPVSSDQFQYYTPFGLEQSSELFISGFLAKINLYLPDATVIHTHTHHLLVFGG